MTRKTAFGKMRRAMKQSVAPLIKMQEEQRRQEEEQKRQEEHKQWCKMFLDLIENNIHFIRWNTIMNYPN